MGSIPFLESLVQYYFPRLDVSALDDDELAVKIAHMYKIRQMEAVSSADKILKSFFS